MLSYYGAGDMVHAGTFFGDFLQALTDNLAPGARLWAFEPNPENYRCARITCELNALSGRVTLRHAGLGADPCEARIRTRDASGQPFGGGSQIVQEPTADTDPVLLCRVDDAVPTDRHVSILQLDVEGYEQAALAGALDMIERCRPVLILEETPGSAFLAEDWFSSDILALGYRRVGTLHMNAVYRIASTAE